MDEWGSQDAEMFTFIERYYNQTRLHSHNRYKTPERD
jgi:transposase InsO family protein